MRSSFSRTFFPAVIVFVAALLLLGTSFQALVRNYLNDQAVEELENAMEVFCISLKLAALEKLLADE